MIEIFDALSWLNAMGNASFLNIETRELIRMISAFSRDDSRIKRILERLRNIARSSSNPLEKAEILLNCAAIGHLRGWSPQAANDAREALISYDDDNHRRAAALWILGMTQWEMCQNHDAHTSWADAREIFRRYQTLLQHFPERAWYRNRIRQMNVDLVARPEEIWTWLNWFEHPCLRPPTKKIVDRVQEKIRQRAYPNVYALMPDLQEASTQSQEIYERAEVYLEFGLAIYQLGNTHFAIELLRKSVKNFYPGYGTYHKQVIARCMLGAVEWFVELSHPQADAHWVRCIEEFEKLRSCSSRDNHQTKTDWYTEHRAILHDALHARRRQSPNPWGPVDGIPGNTNPAPPVSSPADTSTALYQDLLSKVRGDKAVADRLIEYERKLAPTADRNELIRRAIERWIRDNK